MPDVIYGKVDKAMVSEIIDKHIIGKQLITDHIYDRPAADIMKK